MSRSNALEEVEQEMLRQDRKWGEQNHPDGTGNCDDLPVFLSGELAKQRCATAVQLGILTWADILFEEVCEAFDETDPKRLREELIQVAAVAVQWADAINRR